MSKRQDTLLTIVREEVREILDAEDFGLRQIVEAKTLLGSAEKLVAALGSPIDQAEAAIEDDFHGGFRIGRGIPVGGNVPIPDAPSLSQNALREMVAIMSELMPALKAQLMGSAARAMIMAKDKGEPTIADQLAEAINPREVDLPDVDALRADIEVEAREAEGATP